MSEKTTTRRGRPPRTDGRIARLYRIYGTPEEHQEHLSMTPDERNKALLMWGKLAESIAMMGTTEHDVFEIVLNFMIPS